MFGGDGGRRVHDFNPTFLPCAILNLVRKLCWLAVLTLILLAPGLIARPPAAAAAQGTFPPSIFMQSPREGQVLQGLEVIEGKIRGEDLLIGHIHFSYAGAGARDRTWFLIADIEPGVEDSSQTSFRVEWDTSQLTDGNYDLRVLAEYQDGAAIFENIPGLRIRNYSPVESPTPAPVQNGGLEDETAIPSATPLPRSTPTPLPANPAAVREGDLSRALTISGISVAGLFFLGMMYWYLRNRLG